MRVRILFEDDASRNQPEIPGQASAVEERCSTLREDPEAIDRLALPRRYRPLHAFLAAVNSPASVFATECCAVWSGATGPAGNALCEHASRIDLLFARREFNHQRKRWELAAQGLEQLLSKESADDSLRVELRIGTTGAGEPPRYGLRLLLEARGSTPEQAELRWGLGLARVQQAMMFTSRHLRHEQGLVH